MKNIFKKNQIIITALAIMIALVGYLNVSGRVKDKDKTEKQQEDSVQTGVIGDAMEEKEFGDISAEDIGEDIHFEYRVADNGELILVEKNDDVQNIADSEEATEDADYVAVMDENGEELTGETQIADASAETTGEEAGGERETEPGEAIFTSVTISGNYFNSAKLNREQMRARNKETLMNVVADSAIADDLKQEAIDEIIALTARAESENAAEILLEAKGYEGVVVSLSETEADVVVNAASITDQQIAQIEDIVSRKTGISADGIVITPVVTEE